MLFSKYFDQSGAILTLVYSSMKNEIYSFLLYKNVLLLFTIAYQKETFVYIRYFPLVCFDEIVCSPSIHMRAAYPQGSHTRPRHTSPCSPRHTLRCMRAVARSGTQQSRAHCVHTQTRAVAAFISLQSIRRSRHADKQTRRQADRQETTRLHHQHTPTTLAGRERERGTPHTQRGIATLRGAVGRRATGKKQEVVEDTRDGALLVAVAERDGVGDAGGRSEQDVHMSDGEAAYCEMLTRGGRGEEEAW